MSDSGHPPLTLRQQWNMECIAFSCFARHLGSTTPGVSMIINGMFVPITEMIRQEIPMAPYLNLPIAANSKFKIEEK